MPIEPANAAARSDRMSACKLVATMVSRLSGWRTMRTVIASTRRRQQLLCGGGEDLTQHVVKLDIRELYCDLVDDLIPHDHSAALSIGFGDVGKLATGARLGELEGETGNAPNGYASEDGHLGRNLVIVALVGSSTHTCVFTLAVLTYNDPIQLTRFAVGKR